jgi:hypothetical protein
MHAPLPVRRFVAMAMQSAFVLLLSACASSPATQERFRQATGTTWRVAGEPMVFERTEARFSRSARDYTYLGPVALNRRGTYDYFLWIGIGSTLDRGFLAPEAVAPTSLLIFVENEPLELVVSNWDERIPALAGEIPYDPPVTIQRHLAARVTLDQITLISERGIDRLLLRSADDRSRSFTAWGEQPNWTAFLEASP